MKSDWLHYTVLRAASLLAPGDQRAEWLKGWRSELWYVPKCAATPFCLGAFRDALWVRRNNLSPIDRTGSRLESPLLCLAFLTLLAAVSSMIAVLLPAPQLGPKPSHLSVRDLPEGCVGMLLLSVLALPAIRIAIGPGATHYPLPWASRLRRATFLALKIALMLPIMFGGFVLMCSVPVANVGFNVAWILAFRWVLSDQRRRCPLCLRVFTEPVRIGTASRTFLEWYGAESMCSRGHGLLHTSEISPSYSGNSEWLRLDHSWAELFSESRMG